MESNSKEVRILTKKDWVLMVFCALSLIGCIVTFTGRSLLLLFVGLLLIFSDILLKRLILGRKRRVLKLIGLVFINIILLLWAWIFYQSSFPSCFVSSYSDEYALKSMKKIEYIQISFENNDLSGWLYKQSDEKSPLIIFFYGSRMCSAVSMRYFNMPGELFDQIPGYNVLCIDYPSYGYSKGTLSETSMKKMALAIYDEATTWDKTDNTDITAIGYSLGTGPASYLASKRDLSALVLISPYDYYHRLFAYSDKVTDVFAFCCGYNVDAASYATKIDEPSLIITSKADEIVNYTNSLNVANKIKNCKVSTFDTYKHDYMLNTETFGSINNFLKKD